MRTSNEAHSLNNVRLCDQLLANFWAKVYQTNDRCWFWIASKIKGGYGKFSLNRDNNLKIVLAHRFSYLIHYGDPGNELVLHACDVPRCVRPDHLFLGNDQDNAIYCTIKGRHSQLKYDAEVLQSIVEDRLKGLSYLQLGDKYKMSPVHAYRIVKGETRNHDRSTTYTNTSN
jgi:HNH endonuclease